MAVSAIIIILQFIIIIIIELCRQHGVSWLFLAIHPYHTLFMVGLLTGIECQHRVDECKFLLVGQHWCAHILVSLRGHCLWVCLNLFSRASHNVFVLLGWFVRWEAGGCTVAVLWGAASRICWKQQIAFLCSSHLTFFHVFWWCRCSASI